MHKKFRNILKLIVLSLIIMLSSETPVYAANSYTINGKTVKYTDYTSSPNECWVYANNFYNKIWGSKFTSSFSSSDNMLRNLKDSELTLTENHLKEYVSKAPLGACLRVCNSQYLHSDDGWGHSQIIVQKDTKGFTVFEGGLQTYPYCKERYYTWSGYCNADWLGGKYKYIKYIKWPGAPAFPSQVNEWKQNSKGWWYSYADGTYPKNGIVTIKGVNYGFDANGYMVTGWASFNGTWYYFGPTGAMKTGWVQSGSSWYYLDPSTGAMRTGWLQNGSSWYYMDPSTGKMVTGWVQSGSTWYYMDESTGKMTTGWVQDGNNWYFLNGSGKMVTASWSGNYYLEKSGKMVASAYVKNGEKYYWTKSSGLYTKAYAKEATAGYVIYEQSTGVRIQ